MLKPTCLKNVKARHLVISFSLMLIAFSGYSVYSQTATGWDLDVGWSFIIDNNDKIYYALDERISDITLKSDRLSITHSSGTWGFQYVGSKSNITDLSDAGNSFLTTLNNNASIATISNNTIYWPAASYTPKYVNITNDAQIKILAANFKEDLTAFNSVSPPAVFIDKTNSQLIVKSNHTTEATIIEISFQEAPDTGLNDFGVILLMLLVSAGFLLIIYLVVKRK